MVFDIDDEPCYNCDLLQSQQINFDRTYFILPGDFVFKN